MRVTVLHGEVETRRGHNPVADIDLPDGATVVECRFSLQPHRGEVRDDYGNPHEAHDLWLWSATIVQPRAGAR